MSFNLTGMVDNQSQFTLEYETSNASWGYCEINAQTIAPFSNVNAFTGMSEGIFSGCEGTVTYTFTDQHGVGRSITMSYNDPFSGSNSASIEAPPGMAAMANVPSSGSNVTAEYLIAGEPS
jgi:hypothetical protein